MGRAGAVAQTAPQTPGLPGGDLQPGRGPGPGPGAAGADPQADVPGQIVGAELPTGPGRSAAAAPVLLHAGAQPAAAAPPQGLSEPPRAAQAGAPQPGPRSEHTSGLTV